MRREEDYGMGEMHPRLFSVMFYALLFLVIVGLCGCGGGGGGSTPVAKELASIVITPSPPIAAGTTQQLVATGTFSDNSTQVLTGQVSWSSSDNAIASIAQDGKVTAVAAGSVKITATLSGKSGTATQSVTSATLSSIAVTPFENLTISNGQVQEFTATGTFSDGTTQVLSSQVTWNSTPTGVSTATVVIVNGTTTAYSSSTSTITITAEKDGIISGPVTLTVNP